MSQPQKIATIGMFDGVHAGHRHVIEFINELAHRRNLVPAVFSFSNHPLSIIYPERAPKLLSSPDEKKELLSQLGIESVNLSSFTEQTREMTSREFITMLRDRHSVSVIVMGFNNRIGSDRDTDFDGYCRIGDEEGVEIIKAPEFRHRQNAISSTAIRRLLLDGKVEDAATLLCSPYQISGTVVSGKHLGRKIGFPTANLQPTFADKLIPASGVYACIANVGDGVAMPSMVNIGHRPTVDGPGARESIEANIIGFDGDLYNREISLKFISYLRPEVKFESLDKLKAQLVIDRSRTIEITVNAIKYNQ